MNKLILGALIASSVALVTQCEHSTLVGRSKLNEVEQYRKTHPYIETNDFSHEDDWDPKQDQRCLDTNGKFNADLGGDDFDCGNPSTDWAKVNK